MDTLISWIKSISSRLISNNYTFSLASLLSIKNTIISVKQMSEAVGSHLKQHLQPRYRESVAILGELK